MISQNIINLIGKTPMVRINRIVSENDAEVLAKLEKMNIGGSVKDRLALYLIEDAEKKNPDISQKTLIEASSGSTGIALAMIAAVKGYKMTIVMPESVSLERRQLIKAYGAELILSSGEKGTGGAIELKYAIIAQNPEKYISIDQHKNTVNIIAHFDTTAEEIMQDTRGEFDMLVVAIGTGGTGMGISKKIKSFNPNIKVVGVTPKLGVSLQGLRNPMEKNGSEIFDPKCFDEIVEFSSEELPQIFEYSRKLAFEEGILSGMSSGAAMYITSQKAKILGKGKRVITIFPDSGERYLSTNLFE